MLIDDKVILLVFLILNILFFALNLFLIGFCFSKAKSIPNERDIIKGIMESKVPIMAPPNMMPPGMGNENKKGGAPQDTPTYFG